MRAKFLYFIFYYAVRTTFAGAQPYPAILPPPDGSEIRARTTEIKKSMLELSAAGKHLEYPVQSAFVKPAIYNKPYTSFLIPDITPPSDPSNLAVFTSGIFSVYLRFDPSVDVESGISYYAFAIGTAPGLANIRWWQSLGTNTNTQSFSLGNLGIAEGSTFYFTVYCVNGEGLYSNYVSSAPVTMNWENYGDTSNQLTIQYASQGYDVDGVTVIAGWTAAQISKYNHFISRMLPIIKEIYGPPSLSHTVTLVRDLYYSGSNIYFPGSNEIHKDDSFYPQLLTHELIHAFRDDVILAMDANWNYHPRLSGFEESFAQGVSYACMNRYVQLYPNDTVVNPASLYGSSMDWDYDYRNVTNLTTEDFWSDYGGMALHWERYEMGAAAMRKMQLEDSGVFQKFNAAYYAYLNAHHTATPTRSLMISLLASVLPQVEGIPTEDWINHQHIFDCRIEPGRKAWVRTQHYPWDEYIIFQYVHYYETFSNGSDWAYYDYNLPGWVYYDLNGSPGNGVITDINDSVIWQRSKVISNNPGGFGSVAASFTTDNDLAPWPGGDTADFVLNMNPLGLYTLTFTFDTTTVVAHRVIGNPLRGGSGIFGGILHSHGGSVRIDHEGYAPEPPISLVQGAFQGNRQWASVPNPLTGGTDTKPGRLTVLYTDSVGNTFRTFRNIDWGSWKGNQVFLFDVLEMQPCFGVEIFSNNMDDDCDGLTDESSSVVLNLKVLLEGFYQGNGMMTPVLWMNGLSNDPTVCDSLTVELHAAFPPYDLRFSSAGVVHTDGSGAFTFPPATNNNSYYVVAKHRNSMETWSAGPVPFGAAEISYDFTDALSKAYGANSTGLDMGHVGIFSGDVNQDGVVESQDYSDLENAVTDIQLGYEPEDLTGDGVVESSDYSLIENNVGAIIFVSHP